MGSYHYRILNVFAETALSGNPLCVFEDAAQMDAALMQALAYQFNLSETTFILPPTASGATARVRIFTPTFEMPFAGHPTLGTAHVVRDLFGAGDDIRLQMEAGLIPVQANEDAWTLRANAPVSRPHPASRDVLAAMLGLAAADIADAACWVDTGSEQLLVPLASHKAISKCSPVPELLKHHATNRAGRSLAYVWAGEEAVSARFFFLKGDTLAEDFGTGSACANLGGYLLRSGHQLPIARTILQGEHTGRLATLRLLVSTDQSIQVSGRVQEIGRGEISL